MPRRFIYIGIELVWLSSQNQKELILYRSFVVFRNSCYQLMEIQWLNGMDSVMHRAVQKGLYEQKKKSLAKELTLKYGKGETVNGYREGGNILEAICWSTVLVSHCYELIAHCYVCPPDQESSEKSLRGVHKVAADGQLFPGMRDSSEGKKVFVKVIKRVVNDISSSSQ